MGKGKNAGKPRSKAMQQWVFPSVLPFNSHYRAFPHSTIRFSLLVQPLNGNALLMAISSRQTCVYGGFCRNTLICELDIWVYLSESVCLIPVLLLTCVTGPVHFPDILFFNLPVEQARHKFPTCPCGKVNLICMDFTNWSCCGWCFTFLACLLSYIRNFSHFFTKEMEYELVSWSDWICLKVSKICCSLRPCRG